MNSKVEQSRSTNAGDIVKYALAVLLIVAGVFAYTWFEQWPGALRALVVVGGLVAATAVFLTSHKGAQTLGFLSEARFELRKVVWPTRQEAMRTTGVVILAVIIIALLLAGFDVVIQAAVKWLLER